MSVVTNVVLSFHAAEDEEARLAECNDFPIVRDRPFHEVKDYAGSKVLERPTFLGAFNYLDVEGFIGHIRNVKWEMPQFVQLHICQQEEEVYTECFERQAG